MNKLHKHLLEKMLRKRIIGAKHIQYDNILSSVSSHEIGELKQAIKELLRKDYLVWYDKGRKAIQLNKYKLKEIKQILLSED